MSENTIPTPAPATPANPTEAPVVPETAAPRREYTPAERALVAIALLIALLFDRLLAANLGKPGWALFGGIFWLLVLVLYYCYNWNKISKNTIGNIVSGFVLLLCAWNVFFDYNSSYGYLTFLVIPCVCMAHAAFTSGGYSLKQVGAITQEWLLGWFVKPFTAIGKLFGAGASALGQNKNSTVKRVLLGLAIALPMLIVILPLLAGADRVFSYHLGRIFRDFYLPDFTGHMLVVLIAAPLFYSLFWNLRFAESKTAVKQLEARIDVIVSAIVLGTALLVYALFCAVQFTYLFAGAGLPDGMTYSEYAVEGFWQLIVVAGINLLMFGVFLRYGEKRKLMTGLLAALLAVTAVMLVSAALRLKLYTDAYGLTWLRLLSAWFICYLAAVILLCAARMAKEKIPLVAVCALLLLGWYTALGYANPDALIVRYNLATTHDKAAWVSSNANYIAYEMSDDALIALAESYENDDEVDAIISLRRSESPRSLSLASAKVKKLSE